MLVVDIRLKYEKGYLKDGLIFKENVRGENPIEDKEEIDNMFKENKFIYFQNRCVNVTIPRVNIDYYFVKEIDEKHF